MIQFMYMMQKQQEKHWKQLWEDTSELVKKDN